MKKLLFLVFCIGFWSCEEKATNLQGPWETGCETFASTQKGYAFTSCCGSMDLPDLTLSGGQASTFTGAFIDVNNDVTMKTVHLIASLDGETLYLTFHTGLDVVQFVMTKNYTGPYCNCGC